MSGIYNNGHCVMPWKSGKIKEKADICNRQFQSAFTREADSDHPQKGPVHSPPWGK